MWQLCPDTGVLLTTALHTANEILDQILCFKAEDLSVDTQFESQREVSHVYAGGVRLLSQASDAVHFHYSFLVTHLLSSSKTSIIYRAVQSL